MNTLVAVDIGGIVVNLPEDVANVWTNNIDGIVCASALMEYELGIEVDTNHKNKESVLTVTFYKEEDFCFEVRFTYNVLSLDIKNIQFHYSQDFYNNVSVHAIAYQHKLSIDFYNCILVKNEEDMKNLFSFIKFLL